MVDRLHHNPLSRKGFNLIEAAIVLGVVGVVIGTIWVAAATMYENYKVNKTVSDLTQIMKQTQSIISTMDIYSSPIGTDISILLEGAGAIPADWLNGNIVSNPFGGGFSAAMGYYTGADSGLGGTVSFRLSGIKTSQCVKLIAKLSSISTLTNETNMNTYEGIASRKGIRWISANSSSSHTLPISINTATLWCNKENNDIAFSFNPLRTN